MGLFKKKSDEFDKILEAAGHRMVRRVGDELYRSTRMIEAVIFATKHSETNSIEEEMTKKDALAKLQTQLDKNKAVLKSVGFDVDAAWADYPAPEDVQKAEDFLARRKARRSGKASDLQEIVDDIYGGGRRGPKGD